MTAAAQQVHPVTRAVAGARHYVGSVTTTAMWSMDAAETVASLQCLQALAAQVAELQTRVLVHATSLDLPGRAGASSPAIWYASRTRATKKTAHQTLALACALESHDPTRAALAEGTVLIEQAEVIVRAVDELPDDLDPALVEKAERHLLDQAAEFDSHALRVLGQRLLDVVAPDVADAHQATLLERQERDAAARQRLAIWEDGHGKVHGTFTLDALTGGMLKKALMAFAAPKHLASHGPLGERKPTPQRLGQAFAEMIQRFPADQLPKAGGLNATVVVTMTLDALTGSSQRAATVDTGQTISASLARKLACEAGIIPAVLGGKSEVLDLGRTRRFHSKAQRIVALLEQGGCCAEGCDYPPGMTHMHHPDRWSTGGGTNRDGLMVCPRHHTMAHDPAYTMTQLPTGKYTFNRRT